MLSHFSHVQLSVTVWTIVHQAPLSRGFSRQEYRSGSPRPSPGDLPNPGIKLASLTSPALASMFFTISSTWEAPVVSKFLCLSLSCWLLSLLGWWGLEIPLRAAVGDAKAAVWKEEHDHQWPPWPGWGKTLCSFHSCIDLGQAIAGGSLEGNGVCAQAFVRRHRNRPLFLPPPSPHPVTLWSTSSLISWNWLRTHRTHSFVPLRCSLLDPDSI